MSDEKVQTVISEPTPNMTDDAKNADLNGPVAVTYDEALDAGYFGGPSDDTDYSASASVPEAGQQSDTTNKRRAGVSRSSSASE